MLCGEIFRHLIREAGANYRAVYKRFSGEEW